MIQLLSNGPDHNSSPASYLNQTTRSSESFYKESGGSGPAMNRSGVLQSSPVQQMISGSPNWWSINGGAAIRPPLSHHHQQLISSPFFPPPPASPFFSQFSPSSSSSSSSLSLPTSWHGNNQEQLPESWSQLLMGGLVGEEDKRGGMESFHHQTSSGSVVEVKQESSGGGSGSYVYGSEQDFRHRQATKAAWSSHQMMPVVSSPNKSCVTTFSSNMLDFSGTNGADATRIQPQPVDRPSSECNSPASGGGLKKARVQPSASQSTFKVRKEKLGDRITALHQLVSPFGKTDTASVLLEAIGYIRFLQSQIEALSLPYLGSGSGSMRHQQSALFNTSSMKRKGVPDQEEPKKDLRSRGLCLVPVSCTLQVGSDNGADYWAPATLGPGFR